MIFSWSLLAGALLLQLVSTSLADIRVSTFAGTGREGILDGPRLEATFAYPECIAIDRAGIVYVTGSHEGRIRKIIPDGTVSTLNVNWDQGLVVSISGIAINSHGDIFTTITYNDIIYRITPNGSVYVFAGREEFGYVDGPANVARFMDPRGLAFDSIGNLIVADWGNHCIRKITPDGIVSTLSGGFRADLFDDNGAMLQFSLPQDIAVDSYNNVYVADRSNTCIHKITPDGTVSTLAGNGRSGSRDGFGDQARFRGPVGITTDANGNVFVADSIDSRIRKINPDGFVSTVAGNGGTGFRDGPGQIARFRTPMGISADSDGNLLVADIGNSRIRKITFTQGIYNPYVLDDTDQDPEIRSYVDSDEDLGDADFGAGWVEQFGALVINGGDNDGVDSDHSSDNDEAPTDHTPVPPRPINYGVDECAICYESKERGDDYDYCSTSCGNTFHKRCIDRCMRRREQRKCPMCRAAWIMNKPPVAIPTASPDE